MSDAEDAFAWQLKAAGVGEPVREHAFAKPRRWRFDFAWPSSQIAVEIDGGGFIGGAHSRGAGIYRDAEKHNEAVLMGWRVLRVTPAMVSDGSALALIERAFKMVEGGYQ